MCLLAYIASRCFSRSAARARSTSSVSVLALPGACCSRCRDRQRSGSAAASVGVFGEELPQMFVGDLGVVPSQCVPGCGDVHSRDPMRKPA